MSENAVVLFQTDAPRLQARFEAALTALRANLTSLPGAGDVGPVLIEGAEYRGIWLECGPHESLLYGLYAGDPRAARDGHRIFFAHQRDDSYLPCWFRSMGAGTGQVQTVVPIAKTALEAFHLWGGRAFLQAAYDACVGYDGWLARYRDTRGTGLCEAFCEWDTGHDNSPRLAGLPHDCPNEDARVCPDLPGLPYVAPDLSATVYGGRVALAAMADLLGRPDEAARWREAAETTRVRLNDVCWDAEAECFFDLDARGRFVRVVGDALGRVCQEHAVPAERFARVWERHLHSPDGFWATYPLTSVAMNDPAFVRDLPRNSWGGASQALTALRAPRWMGHYGKHAALDHLMARWLDALARADSFRQQISPWTGEFTADGGDGYSPSLLCLIDFAARRYGVVPLADGSGQLEWNARVPDGASFARSTLPLPGGGVAEIETTNGRAVLRLGGATVATVTGGPCRLVTDAAGRPLALVGTAPEAAEVAVTTASGGEAGTRPLRLPPDAVVPLA